MTAVIYLLQQFLLENANSLVFICGIDVWNVSNEIFEALGMGALYYALLLVVDVLAYACNDICNFVWEGNKSVWVESMADCIAWENVLIYNYSLVRRIFGKSAVETLSKREWIKFLVFPIFTIFMIAWMLVVVQSSQAGPGKIPIVLAFSFGRTQCFYLWIAL